MDRYLIDLMLEQVHKGNRIGHTFNNRAWIDMGLSFLDRFGLQNDKDLLKIHHKSLGRVYSDMKNLLEQKGFCWDERRQMVTAYGDVWTAYIKVHCLLLSLTFLIYWKELTYGACRNTQMHNHTEPYLCQIIMICA